MNDCVAAYQENLGLIEEIPNFLDGVITCDESWVHYFNPKKFALEVTRFSMKKGEPAEIGREGAHDVFFDCREPIFYPHAVSKKVKIDVAYYCRVLQQ